MNIRTCRICNKEIDFDEPYCNHETMEESAWKDILDRAKDDAIARTVDLAAKELGYRKVKKEVFVGYDDRTEMDKLTRTLDAWDTDEYEPVAIHVKSVDNLTTIRVAAEAIATDDYVIVDLTTGDPIEYKKGSIKVEKCDPRIN